MFHASYTEVAADTQDTARALERDAFAKAVRLLEAAQASGPGSRDAVEAILFTSRLWSVLMEDLAAEGNGLPEELRASLISVGIWVLRRTEDIRSGKTADFQAIIDVMQTIGKGLGRN